MSRTSSGRGVYEFVRIEAITEEHFRKIGRQTERYWLSQSLMVAMVSHPAERQD
jgi:hypothetical protein